VWRHAANGFMMVTGIGQDYLILGPLRGGGVLVELGWIANYPTTGQIRYAAAITGSPSPTIGNLRGGTSLIHRSNDAGVVFGVPTIRLQVARDKESMVVLPMSVRLDTGGLFIIMGIWAGTVDLDVNTLAWALEVGGPGSAGYQRPMVNGQRLGVKDGPDR